MQQVIVEIDGDNIFTLEDFCEQIWPLLSNTDSGGTTNLDALNDIFSWPASPYTFIWKNSEKSRSNLGYPEMVQKLAALCQTCHRSNIGDVKKRLDLAMSGEGPTMFDWLIEIIRENERYVTLELK